MSKAKYQYVRVKGVKIRIHRYIMQEHLGRNLDADEHVYHINGDPRDNRIENLIVIKKKSR